jgi:glycosyltransferase involved in cell wall biosynthesis
MKVAMTTFGGDGGRSGISRYIIQLLDEWSRAPAELELDVLLYEDEREVFLPSDSPLGARTFPGSLRPPLRNILWHQRRLPGLCREERYDVLFLPAANRRVPLTSPIPTVGCVHDFSAIHLDGKYDRARMAYIRHVLPRLVRRLDRVVTVSQSSARDIIEFARVPEERVTVIPLGVDHARFHSRIDERETARVAERYGLRAPYVLYTSRLEHPGKNHANLIHAFARATRGARGDVQLVLTGSPWLRADAVYAAAKQHSGLPVHFTGFVDEADLPALYAGAHGFVFPSLYEGFGIPILEAMACGVPVACSDVSSMPEVAGHAALRFDPHDQDAIAQALDALIHDEDARDRCRAAGLARARQFTWSRCADHTRAVLHEALGEPPAAAEKAAEDARSEVPAGT